MEQGEVNNSSLDLKITASELGAVGVRRAVIPYDHQLDAVPAEVAVQTARLWRGRVGGVITAPDNEWRNNLKRLGGLIE